MRDEGKSLSAGIEAGKPFAGMPKGRGSVYGQRKKGSMAEDTRNRNALRSKRLLKRAFSELLAEKPYDKITVTDITRRADLSRGTFYAHYDSITDLLKELINEIMTKLLSVVDIASTPSFLDDPDPVIKLVSDNVTQEESLYRTLMGTSAADSFISLMKQNITNRIMENTEDDPAAGGRQMMQVSVTYIAGGLVDIYCAWLRGDYGSTPISEVNKIASNLVRSLKPGLKDLGAVPA